MTSANQAQIDRLTRDIAELRRTEARETGKEADIQSKINRANEAISRTKSPSILQSKAKEIERALKALSVVQMKRAGISRKIADKSKMLRSCEDKQAHENEKERKKIANEQKRLIREREKHEQQITSEIRRRVSPSRILAPDVHPQEIHDFFISHASEDKDGFVRGLALALQVKGAKVWYDEFTLQVGDSLRRKIDQGLANSRFGIVVLSKHFFSKEWPQKELDGLLSLEVEGGTRILPIWHEISKDEVARHSPMLADKIALNTSLKSTSEIAADLYDLVD